MAKSRLTNDSLERTERWKEGGPREQLRHGVAAVVRNQILSGQMLPLEIIRLGPIAEELGVSITPVREALLLLSEDGWLVQEPNRGFRVREVRRQDIEDVYAIWGLLEGEIAARAAQVATTEDVAELREIDQRLAFYDPRYEEEGLALNRLFHDKLEEIASAPKLSWFKEKARRSVPFEFWFSFHRVPGWHDVNRYGHSAVVGHIQRKEEDAARENMRAHLVTTGALLLSWLDSLAVWSSDGRLDVRGGAPGSVG